MVNKLIPPLHAGSIINATFISIQMRLGMTFQEVFTKVLDWTLEQFPSPPLANGYAQSIVEMVAYRFQNGVGRFDDLLIVCQSLGIECDIALGFPVPEPKYPEIWDKEIDELGMTVRATNVLKADLKFYIGDLVRVTYHDLMRIPNLGRVSVKHIAQTLAEHGLSLDTDVGDWKPPVK